MTSQIIGSSDSRGRFTTRILRACEARVDHDRTDPLRSACYWRGVLIGGSLTQGRQETAARGPASLRAVKAVKVHDLVPSRHEVPYELRSCIVAGIHLREGAQPRIRSKDEVHG